MSRIPFRVKPMLATLISEPFEEEGWVYEEKYDGIRILAYKEGSKITLLTRNEVDRSGSFPSITQAIGSLRATTLLLDGELIVLDKKNVSRFQLLQQGDGNVRFAAFDCLFSNGQDFRRHPLSVRRLALEKVIKKHPNLILSRRLADTGFKAFEIARERGYEGLVAKRIHSLYNPGRSRDWLKVKVNHEDEFVIVGYTIPEGTREYFGALLLGAYQQDKLRYVGNVGTGFKRKDLASLFAKFRRLRRQHPTVENVPRIGRVTFLSPKLVAQISYSEWTADQKLRHPVFLGLRDDKNAREVQMPISERRK